MDLFEILLIAAIIYNLIKWVKNTRAWFLFKGIAVLLVFYLLATLLNFDVVLWIFGNTIGVGITALVIVFQPELRKALEQLGQKNLVSPLLEGKDKNVKFSDETLEELVKAVYNLAKTKTGALIVIEGDVTLDDFESTGILLDALISSQLLENIFEHNTPLHDGAIIVNGDRVTAATCYLPLSDNMHLSKELGTRHRAGVGISEVTDSFTIIVSEETGSVSVAFSGRLSRHISRDFLHGKLEGLQKKAIDTKVKKRRFWKGWGKHEKLSNK